MKLSLLGLGKMGYNLALNLIDQGHEVITYDINHEQVKEISSEGAIPAYSTEEVIQQLESPRIIWAMVPAGEATEALVSDLQDKLDPGDIIIDGGNSNYKDSIRRGNQLKEKGIHFYDVGTSGGINGARNGICAMIGGEQEVFKEIEPIFESVTVENGYLYTGPLGSGHFLKMVHNGIEYGMMQSIAEGFDILSKSPFDFDYESVSKVWNHGSVISSWLMELTEGAFAKDANLDGIKGVMNSSGEGKWAVESALDMQVAAPVIALSLMMRYRSLEEDTFTGKVVAALRNEFGGHDVIKN